LNHPRITVAICTYNRERYLPGLFRSIQAQTLASNMFEVVLIDNNSPGNTHTLFQQFVDANPNLSGRYFLEKNQGLSFARNRAIRESGAELITFLDDDAFIHERYLETLLEGFDRHSDCGAIGGPIHLHYEEVKPLWENKYLNSLLGYFDKGNAFFYFNKDYPRGSNMAFRTSVFESVGPFNVALGRIGSQLYGGEEKDLFNRIYRAKIPVIYLPKALVYHCVPLARTSTQFIKQQALGTGISERIRSRSEGRLSYVFRLAMEGAKWVASILLWIRFGLTFQFQKGNMLLFFRYWVTRGLVFKYEGS